MKRIPVFEVQLEEKSQNFCRTVVILQVTQLSPRQMQWAAQACSAPEPS